MRVLVAEDDGHIRNTLREILRFYGHEVIEAADGLEALEKARDERPDVILSDGLMPKMDGFTLLREIKADKRLKEIPFVFYSAAYTGSEEVDLALSAGAAGYIIKPKKPEDLWKELKVILGTEGKRLKKTGTGRIKSDAYLEKYGRIVSAKLEKKVHELEDALQRVTATEDALRSTTDSLNAIIRSSPLAIVVLDIEGNVTLWNPAAERIFGWRGEEVVGKLHPIVPQEKHEEFRGLLRRARGGEALSNIELVRQRKDGTLIEISLSTAPLHAADGSVTGILSLISDISEKKRAERALVEEKNRTEAIIAAMGDGISIQNREFTILYENEVQKGLIGDHVGRHCYEVYEKRESVCEGCPVAAVFADGKVHRARRSAPAASGTVHVEITASPLRDAQGMIIGGIEIIRDITDRVKAEEAAYQTSRDWEETFNSITDMVTIHDKDWNIIRSNTAAEKILGLPLLEKTPDRKCFRYYHGTDRPPEGCPSCDCLNTGETATFEVFEPHLNAFIEIRAIPRFDSRKNLVGLIHVVRDITERRKSEEYVQRQIERMTALRSIDMAISSTLDLRVTLHILLEQVTAQLKVDAADVLLLDPHSMILSYTVGRGFRTREVEKTQIRLGQGFAGQAAMQHRVVSYPDLGEGGEALTAALKGESFRAYFGVPLTAKGQVKGVLEIFHRTPLQPDSEWMNFLEMLGGQAAIAVDNVSMFDTLQRSHTELIIAYDTTIEGWSRALDYRDKETEGHSQRVTELTVLMSRAMGMHEDELVHVRRGALLHDIGKLGVPDSILLKPGKLTDEEWMLMKRHPVIAFELLSPISFLRPATDIPYCHHEKWDGTGYPRGLRGEQIPLAARIFAIIDVWDALRSDRPYRPAWPADKTLEHIRSLSGTHFDPDVAAVFLKTVVREAE